MEPTSEKKTIPQISVDARLLYERLKQLAQGETISYAALSETIGRDVRGRARHLLDTARRRALVLDNVVLEAIVNEGLRRLTDAENIASTGESGRRRVRGIVRRTVRKLAAVDFGNLSNADRVKHNAEVSQLGAIAAFVADNVTRRIEARIAEAQAGGPLPIAKTLDVFRSS